MGRHDVVPMDNLDEHIHDLWLGCLDLTENLDTERDDFNGVEEIYSFSLNLD